MQPEAICYRDGKPGATERAHVFPRQLFGDSTPDDLIAVPSHPECNRPFGADEEYFRAFVIDYWSAEGKAVWDGPVRRSIRRPEGQGFRKRLNAQIVPLLVPTGDDRGYGHIMKADRARIDRVLENMARGLAFHDRGLVLDVDADFTTAMFGDFDKAPPDSVRSMLENRPWQRVGAVVEYQWASATDDPQLTVASMKFYGRRWFIVISAPVRLISEDK